SHALLTRPPLAPQPKSGSPFDLHVLSMPPAFVLSQDQTLKLTRCQKHQNPLKVYSLHQARDQKPPTQRAQGAELQASNTAHPPPAPLFHINNVKEQKRGKKQGNPPFAASGAEAPGAWRRVICGPLTLVKPLNSEILGFGPP